MRIYFSFSNPNQSTERNHPFADNFSSSFARSPSADTTQRLNRGNNAPLSPVLAYLVMSILINSFLRSGLESQPQTPRNTKQAGPSEGKSRFKNDARPSSEQAKEDDFDRLFFYLFQDFLGAKNRHSAGAYTHYRSHENRRKQSFPSFSDAPTQAQNEAKWCKILGLNPDSYTERDITKAYRNLARTNHPDKGGNKDKFSEIASAHEGLKKIIEDRAQHA